jgi:hypothetical protein
MNKCSDCYWKSQCEDLTNLHCDDFTPLYEEEYERKEYLETVRADLLVYAEIIPDFE